MTVPQRIVLIEKPQASEPGFYLVPPAPPGGRSGRSGEVIELSNRRKLRTGGHHPMAPQVLTKVEITEPLAIGHTTDYSDDDAPIIVREADTIAPDPGGTGYAEGRCTQCIAQPVIARGDTGTLLVLEHKPGCTVMARLLRETGMRP